MHSKTLPLTNFSHAIKHSIPCLRPENEQELMAHLKSNQPRSFTARGAGLSYSDSALSEHDPVVNMQRLNHFIEFDPNTGVLVCQGGVSFQDLFLVHPDYIPPVIPGTVHATLAGGVAHDVHGKDNPLRGSFGQHILWLELLINDQIIRCSPSEHSDLFYASIGGLGLTGFIMRMGIRLRKATRFVAAQYETYDHLEHLINRMSTEGLNYDYQMAWLDLLHQQPRAVLSLANHAPEVPLLNKTIRTIPKLPFALINAWNMKFFNQFYFHQKRPTQQLSLLQFNNPLDKLKQWPRLYGPKGFIQFQAVFKQDNALAIINQLLEVIKRHQATPTLAVLKLFTQAGPGLLSFCRPGFTLAIDFLNNSSAQNAIKAMNQLICQHKGRVYLAKDLLLTPDEYQQMYEPHQQFKQVLSTYHCTMNSALAARIGITS